MTASDSIPGRLLLHPVALIALATWAVNDHLFKVWWPGHPVTGKLSDVASLIVFPLLVGAAFEWAAHISRRRVRSMPVVVGAALATACVMAAINTWPPAARVYEVGLGALQWPWAALASGSSEVPLRPVRLWMDATDLFTLPAAAVPTWLAWHSQRPLAPRRANATV